MHHSGQREWARFVRKNAFADEDIRSIADDASDVVEEEGDVDEEGESEVGA